MERFSVGSWQLAWQPQGGLLVARVEEFFSLFLLDLSK